jgi:hypothetical protein
MYEVSNRGRIRSYKNARGYNEKHNVDYQILKPIIDKKGYNTIDLRKNNKRKTFKIHRLVALAFIENIKNKKIVHHKNAMRTDNRVENLEWVTPLENVVHAIEAGRYNCGKSLTRIIDKNKVIFEFESAKKACKFLGKNDAYIANHKIKPYRCLKDCNGKEYQLL